MKKVMRMAGCGMLLMVGLCSISRAEHDGMGEMSAKHEKMAQKIDKELKLTADQQSQLKAFRADQKMIMQGITQQLQEKRLAMKAELAKLESDRGVIDQLASEIKQLSGQMIDLRTAAMLKMKEVLSVEQFKKFIEIIDKGMKKGPPPSERE